MLNVRSPILGAFVHVGGENRDVSFVNVLVSGLHVGGDEGRAQPVKQAGEARPCVVRGRAAGVAGESLVQIRAGHVLPRSPADGVLPRGRAVHIRHYVR